MLTIVHTADWHLGMRFRYFNEEDERKLRRSRLDAVDRVFGIANRVQADAVLCAGDLFDSPEPEQEWWDGLVATLQRWNEAKRPTFLLPGNHDPLVHGSIWSRGHPFRQRLPDWVTVIDEDLQVEKLGNEGVLFAVPCTSSAGANDPTDTIPKRDDEDHRVRIGMAHGSTWDAVNAQVNFPIASDAAEARGLDYLAIGDTHGFRVLPTRESTSPCVYPGAPEQTAFDETDAGFVAVVTFVRSRRRPRIKRQKVSEWTWRSEEVSSLAELRALRATHLGRTALRLVFKKMVVSPSEHDELEAILRELRGTDARHGLAGVLEVRNQSAVEVQGEADLEDMDLPPTLVEVVKRLNTRQDSVGHEATRQLARLLRSMN